MSEKQDYVDTVSEWLGRWRDQGALSDFERVVMDYA